MTDDQITSTVRELLAEVLGRDAGEILPAASVMNDLGAESIDLLDLRFRLERAFGFKITNQDLAKAVGDKITVEEFRRGFTVASLGAYVGARVRG